MKRACASLLLFVLLLCGCERKPSPDVNTEKFLRKLLFFDKGIYTLLGSKPITMSEALDVDSSLAEIAQEIPITEHIQIYLNRHDREDRAFFKTLTKAEKKQVSLISDEDWIFDAFTLWEEWEAKKPSIDKNYLLFAHKMDASQLKSLTLCKAGYSIYFVNVGRTACILQQHYDLFTGLFGGDFDPLEEVRKMNNPDSPLVRCVMGTHPKGTHVHRGILHGYGWENSQLFTWKMTNGTFYKEPQEKSFAFWKREKPFSTQSFPLPAFAVASPLDPQKVQYEKEREQIKEFYRGKDFVKATLSILTDQM